MIGFVPANPQSLHNSDHNGGALTLYQGKNLLVRNNIFVQNHTQEGGKR
jgi:hypothetical protein